MVIKIENDYLSADISTFGAELQSLSCKKTGKNYLWYGKEEIWSGRSPILFPIIGRLLDDSYRLDGEEYTLPKHGFARKSEFSVFEKGDYFAVFSLKDSENTLRNYPYHFELRIKFELCKNTVKVTHSVFNNNDRTMYFSIGAHPAFNIDIGDKIIFDEKENLVTMRIDENGILNVFNEPLLNNEKEITVTEDIFRNDALILENVRSKRLKLVSRKNGDILYFNSGDAPYLGIWAKPGAPYVCIEPWWGVNDDYNKKDDLSQKNGIQALEKHSKFECSWSAELL